MLQNYYYDLGHETSLHKFVGDFNVTKSASKKKYFINKFLHIFDRQSVLF